MGSPLENAQQLKDDIRAYIDPIFAPTVGRFVSENSENIPPPLRPFQAAYQRMCDIFASTGALGSVLGGIDVLYDPACRDYLGADLPEYQPGSEPPFAGGQCAGTVYQVTIPFTARNRSSGVVVSREGSGQGLGPVTVARIFDSPGGVSVEIMFANTIVGGVAAGNADIETQEAPQVSAISGPDNCGNLPGTLDGWPPTRTTPPPPDEFIFDDESGPPVSIAIGPLIQVNGYASLTVDVGGVQLDFGRRGGESPPPSVPAIPDIQEGTTTPTTEQLETDPLPGNGILVGAAVNVVVPWPHDTQVFQGVSGPLVFPRNGTILFVDEFGSTTYPFDISLPEQIVPCPVENKFRTIRSVPLPGVSWNVTPLFIEE